MRMLSGGLLVLGLIALAGGVVHAAQDPGSPARVSQRGGVENPAKPANVVVQPSVNLNTATLAQLETLPGVGPSTAQRIIEYRQKNGGFKKIEEILENSRSGPVLLRILDFAAHQTVSRSLQNSHEISR